MTLDGTAMGKRRSAFSPAEVMKFMDAASLLHCLPQYARAVTPTDMTVLWHLARHLKEPHWAGSGTIVCPSSLSLAIDTGFPEKKVARSIKRLVELHLIERAVLLDQAQGYDISPLIQITPIVRQAHREKLAQLGESDPTESGVDRDDSPQN